MNDNNKRGWLEEVNLALFRKTLCSKYSWRAARVNASNGLKSPRFFMKN